MFSAYPFYNCHNGHRGGIYNNLIVNTPEIRYYQYPYPYPIINETINTNQFQGQNQGSRS